MDKRKLRELKQTLDIWDKLDRTLSQNRSGELIATMVEVEERIKNQIEVLLNE